MSAHPELPQGTVYGVLMNTESECQALAGAMQLAPYQKPPQAPVLYIKTANTYTASGGVVRLPADVPEVALGGSFLMGFRAVAGVDRTQLAINNIANGPVQCWRLALDLCVPHSQFYRPPVKHHCRDGFLGLGTPIAPDAQPEPPPIELWVNGALVQRIDWSGLQRAPEQLLDAVREFTHLQAGDELMIGTVFNKPTARAGDTIELRAAGHPPLTITLERA
jgi:5-oxopent-3-ene-1,2,5-tricarboxylate decarboxylase / 2-hydroxyhepta-2,4-diene-1,7-dioate isomerase